MTSVQYENFDTEAYTKYFEYINEFEIWVLRCIDEAFKSGKVKGDRVMDFGCGPVPHRMGTPSRYCKSITYSDFSETNVNYLQTWLKSETSEPPFRQWFKHLAELEEFEDVEAGILSIEQRIKDKVTGVVKCDVLNENPLGEVDHQLFDVIYSGACLESASSDLESYVSAIKNLTSLLNDGGCLILTGFIGCTFYVVGDTKLPCFKYDAELVKTTLEDIGYEILELTTLTSGKPEVEYENTLSDADGCICIVAKKK